MKTRHLIILASIFILPALAYIIARALVTALSMNPGLSEVILISLTVFAILLIVPYLMLKSTFHNAKQADQGEHELHVKDLPLDQTKPEIKYPDRH